MYDQSAQLHNGYYDVCFAWGRHFMAVFLIHLVIRIVPCEIIIIGGIDAQLFR